MVSTLPVRCPRCSSLRIEGLDTCPRCQWRYVPETVATPLGSEWVAPASAAPPGQQVGHAAAPVPVSLQSMDRRTMARWSLAALQLRCLGTLGGCAGMLVGAFVGLTVGGALTSNGFVAILGLFVGAIVGAGAGMLVALRLMAR